MNLSLNLILIIVTVLTSLYAWNNESVMRNWIFNPYIVRKKKQFHRFITSGFIHNDYIHLFFNMFTMYFFGESIERTYLSIYGGAGAFYFLALYFLGILISDLPTYFKHRHNPGYNSLGASGGVSAIIFSWIIFYPTQSIYIWGLLPLPGFLLGVLFLVYSYYEGKRLGGRINHDAHLFGALFGIVFTIVTVPAVIGSFFDQLMRFDFF